MEFAEREPHRPNRRFAELRLPDRDNEPLDWALAYARAGMRVFPCRSDKRPLTEHGFKDATTDPEIIRRWWMTWPRADVGWALSADVVVADLDMKSGQNGFRDFERLEGCDPRSVIAPMSATPSGGLQIFYRASRSYKNLAPAIPGTGIDTRSEGGFVVLPAHKNGRSWVKSPLDVEMPPAPAWLDCAMRETRTRPTPTSVPSSDPWAERKALSALDRACSLIAAAACGSQDATRHAQCFFIGGMIANGDIPYEAAYARLVEAAHAQPAYRGPWRNLEKRVEDSIRARIAHPLPFSDTELFIRNLRLRLEARKLAPAEVK
jgi:putative DNA primase/helicase